MANAPTMRRQTKKTQYDTESIFIFFLNIQTFIHIHKTQQSLYYGNNECYNAQGLNLVNILIILVTLKQKNIKQYLSWVGIELKTQRGKQSYYKLGCNTSQITQIIVKLNIYMVEKYYLVSVHKENRCGQILNEGSAYACILNVAHSCALKSHADSLLHRLYLTNKCARTSRDTDSTKSVFSIQNRRTPTFIQYHEYLLQCIEA